MSDEADNVASLLEAFEQDEAAHASFLDRVEVLATPPPLGLDTPPEPVELEEVLRQFRLDERQARRLASDPGFTGDLVVIVSRLLKLVDPALRAAFPWVNAFLESAAAGIPAGSLLVHALLALAEGPLLSLLESWLAAKAKEVESIKAEFAAEDAGEE